MKLQLLLLIMTTISYSGLLTGCASSVCARCDYSYKYTCPDDRDYWSE